MTMRVERSPVLIVGAGIAGLTVALNLQECTVLTRGSFGTGGSTAWAQGGIAAAIDAADSAAEHARDTLKAGGGIVDPIAAKTLTEAGHEAIDWLVELGAKFDHDDSGELALSREGGHRLRRVVHAEGDATGAEILRALSESAKGHAGIRFVPGARALDFARLDGRIVGVVVRMHGGETVLHLAPAVVLATGGACRVYSHTTNPPDAAGDGVAMAARARAILADMEFVQFHPTALDAGLDPMPLLTEALRGEGATLVNDRGERFMVGLHPDAELAPRDVVARAIWAELQAGRKVCLDATKVMRECGPERFALCREAAKHAGLDPETDLLPVSPAAHYHIGGVAVDLEGRSSLPGLWAVGETTATGVHGANRLASNSLLEGVVFGMAAARCIASERLALPEFDSVEVPAGSTSVSLADPAATIETVRQTMWENVGLVRDATGLASAISTLESLEGVASKSLGARNLRLVGELIACAALARTESRGTHFRSDFPEPDPNQAKHAMIECSAVETESIATKEPSPSR